MCIVANSNSHQQTDNKTATTQEAKLIDYEIIKTEKLSSNRLSLTVLVKETPTMKQLEKIATHIAKDQKSKNDNVYGMYIVFTKTREETLYTYGQAEYGPNGSAGYDFKNPNPSEPDKLNMSRVHISDATEEKFLDDNEKILNEMKPKKEELKKHVANVMKGYKIDNIDSSIVDRDLFDVSFDIDNKPNDIQSAKSIGTKAIQHLLNSNPPQKIESISVMITNNQRPVGLVRYITENGGYLFMHDGKNESFNP